MSTDTHVTDLSGEADDEADEGADYGADHPPDETDELHDERGPVWVSYAGLQARLWHLGWLGEELTGVLDRHEAGMRVEGLLSVITAECAAVARTALALAADPDHDPADDADDPDPDDYRPDTDPAGDAVPDPAHDWGDTDGPAAGRPIGGDAA